MDKINVEIWKHHHTFNINKQHIEKKTFLVVIITATLMIAEITFGLLTNSMALFADGLHMGTHAFALCLSLIAYIVARKYSENDNFTFGTWKIEILGAYSSALVLVIVAIAMIYTSIERLLHPLTIHYNEALFVVILGLIVNLICAIILNTGNNTHTHEHHGNHDHHHDGDDLNLKSAYLHVIADALTSVFALIALLGAKYYKLNWLDPAMGIVGAILISRWAALLLRDSARILLDYNIVSPLTLKIKNEIESDGNARISDLHLWKVSDNNYSCIISVVSTEDNSIEYYKKKLENIHELAHVTIETNVCDWGR